MALLLLNYLVFHIPYFFIFFLILVLSCLFLSNLLENIHIQTQLVVIALDLDKMSVERALDACLVSEDEYLLGREIWETWENPFAVFAEEDQESEEEYDSENEKDP